MVVTKKFYKKVKKGLGDVFDNGVSLLCDYSGEGMFGKKCLGVRSSYGLKGLHEFYHILYNLSNTSEDKYRNLREEINNFFNNINVVCMDNSGLDIIIYFPDIHVEEEGGAICD